MNAKNASTSNKVKQSVRRNHAQVINDRIQHASHIAKKHMNVKKDLSIK